MIARARLLDLAARQQRFLRPQYRFRLHRHAVLAACFRSLYLLLILVAIDKLLPLELAAQGYEKNKLLNGTAATADVTPDL